LGIREDEDGGRILSEAGNGDGDGDGGRILPEAENGDGDGEYFKWWGNEW
jgi:hypothetical protein